MQVSRVVYQRVVSIGKFETERVEIEVALNDGESASEAFAKARRFVHAKLGLLPDEAVVRNAYKTLEDAGLVQATNSDDFGDFDESGADE